MDINDLGFFLYMTEQEKAQKQEQQRTDKELNAELKNDFTGHQSTNTPHREKDF